MSDFNGKLVQMANRIAAAFAAQGADPAKDAAAHIEAFWPAPMRARIVAHLAAGGEGLTEVATAAVRRLRESSADVTAPVEPSN